MAKNRTDREHSGPDIDLKAGRRKVARSRGALSGVLLIVLGAVAALAPFIGPWFGMKQNPAAGDSWHWTSGRGLYELLPGAVTVLAGIVLLVSASRAVTVFFAWVAAVAGIWLVVAQPLAPLLSVDAGSPANKSNGAKAVQQLVYFYGVGALIILVAGTALGRLATHSVRDVRAAERRNEHERAAAEREDARLAEERAAGERAERERLERERGNDGQGQDVGDENTRRHHHLTGHDDRDAGRHETGQPVPQQTAPQQPAQQPYYPPAQGQGVPPQGQPGYGGQYPPSGEGSGGATQYPPR